MPLVNDPRKKKKKKKKAAGGSSSGSFTVPSASGSSSTRQSGSKNFALSGSSTGRQSGSRRTALSGGRPLPAKPIAAAAAEKEAKRRTGGGWRGTTIESRAMRGRQRAFAHRTSAKGRVAAPSVPRARSDSGKFVSTRGTRGFIDEFELMVKTYSAEKAQELSETFLEILLEEMPYRDGGLAASAHIESIDETTYTATAHVVVDAEYAAYVNDGTGDGKPHPAPEAHGRALVFDIDGETVFAKSTQGQEANPFWQRALARWPEVVASVGE